MIATGNAIMIQSPEPKTILTNDGCIKLYKYFCRILFSLKPILTILLLLLFFQGFAQDDSMLQRLLDSARTAAPVIQKPPSVNNDTTKQLIKPVIKKDSLKASSH